MTPWFLVLAHAITLLFIQTDIQTSFAITGGWVYNGSGFEQRDLYIAKGLFVSKRPTGSVTEIDAEGRYIVPPYGDAHTHNLDREWQFGFLPDQYVSEGTFYVQNLTTKTKRVDNYRKRFASTDTIDVAYSHQGLTSTLGHPFMAYEPFAMGINDSREWPARMDEIKKSRLDEGNSYLFMDTVEDAREKLPGYFEAGPDIVKLFFSDIGSHAIKTRDDVPGNTGLTEDVARYIVAQARQRGLRTIAHIDTAEDFETALRIGIDAFAHIPSWNGSANTLAAHRISDETMLAAGKRNVGLTPTLSILALNLDEEQSAARLGYVQDFIRRFLDAGGKLWIASG
ncbi:MAG: hypothetical protein AAGB51_01010 [Planctomycetota bacterium]